MSEQAFPSVEVDVVDGTEYRAHHLGMTLRDYFAAHALAGMLGDHESASIMSSIDAAQAAYDYADAMLKVRAE